MHPVGHRPRFFIDQWTVILSISTHSHPRKSPPQQNRLECGTLKMIGWAYPPIGKARIGKDVSRVKSNSTMKTFHGCVESFGSKAKFRVAYLDEEQYT